MSPHHLFLRRQDAQDQHEQGDRSVGQSPDDVRGPDPQDHHGPSDRTVGQDLDNIFRLTAAPPVSAPPGTAQHQGAERARTAGPEPRRVTPTDLDAALDMLNRAAKAMDLMQSRYKHIEDYAKDVADRAEKDIAAADAQVREWEARARSSESKLDEFRHRTVEAERRAETAERRAETAERSADVSERGAKESREWLECFYDKIVTSFDTRSFLKSDAA